MKQLLLTIEGIPYAYIGYVSETKWKSYEMPCFDLEQTKRIVDEDNRFCNGVMLQNNATDTFYVSIDGEVRKHKGEDYQTVDGIKHLYDIGAGYWLWEAVNIQHLAEDINDFMIGYDPHEYYNQYDNSDQVVKCLVIFLAENLDKAAKAYEIMNSDWLGDDEMFERLAEVLEI
jgi:hypothetical protein